MADKRGKKSLTAFPKSVSSKAPRKKDDSSAKRTRTVIQSDSEDSVEVMSDGGTNDSPVSGGKFSSKTPVSKGDKGKGVSNDKTGKTVEKGGAPSGSQNPLRKVELKLKEELPKNAKCLMDCEAATILHGIAEYLPSLSDDKAVKILESFQKGLEYAEGGNYYEFPESVRKELEKLKQGKVSDGEICILANVCPETVDEVYAFLPSLKANKEKNEGLIKVALSNLEKLKKSKSEEEEFCFPQSHLETD